MTEIKTQLSVLMENRPGALADLTEALTDSGVNILAISVPDTGEFGTVRIVTDHVAEAKSALEQGGFPHAAIDVLLVQLPHRPGSLSTMARLLADERVEIRYAYASNPDRAEFGLCVLQVDDIHKAQSVLNQKLTL